MVEQISNVPIAQVVSSNGLAGYASAPAAEMVSVGAEIITNASSDVPPPTSSTSTSVTPPQPQPQPSASSSLAATAVADVMASSVTQIQHATYNITLANQNEELSRRRKSSSGSALAGNSTTFGISALHTATDSLSGSFEVPAKIRRFGVASQSVLDFSIAIFVNKVIKITTGKVIGKLEIIVPRGVCVEVHDPLSFIGAGATRYGEFVEQNPHPKIEVSGFTITGGIKVKVNREVPPIQIIGA